MSDRYHDAHAPIPPTFAQQCNAFQPPHFTLEGSKVSVPDPAMVLNDMAEMQLTIARLTSERDEARAVYANRERFLDTQRDAIRLATIEECAGVCDTAGQEWDEARASIPKHSPAWFEHQAAGGEARALAERLRALGTGTTGEAGEDKAPEPQQWSAG